MQKVKLENKEYNVNPIPPYLHAIMDYYGALQKQTPETLEVTLKIASEAKQCLTEIISATVTPTPPDYLFLELYNVAIEETNKALERAKKFRNQQ